MMHTTALLIALAASSPDLETMRLFDFSNSSLEAQWRPIHDGVMGGLSRGQVSQRDDSVHFAGELSLENNGGFASFRLSERLPDLSKFDGLRLRVRGDGQVYQLRCRTEGRWDGVSWQTSFATQAGEWTTVDLTFEELIPSWRGRFVTEATPFEPSEIRELGIMITDKQSGPFELEIASIEAWCAKEEGAGSLAQFRLRTNRLATQLDEGKGAETLLETLRSSERVLVLTAPGDLDANISKQLGELRVHNAQLADAELRLVNLMGQRGGRVAGRTLSKAQVRELRKAWELPSDEWGVALVGKDGSVKARWSSKVTTKEILAQIEAMPMRIRELKERTKPE